MFSTDLDYLFQPETRLLFFGELNIPFSLSVSLNLG